MKNMMKKSVLFLFVFILVSFAYAHCEIPCGIYGDEARIDLIKEHVQTLEKSMDMIVKLSKEKNIDYNQLVRWIDNKEEHAVKIQDIATQYFMFQRIKPQLKSDKEAYEKYSLQLENMHAITVYAMKCKQGTDKVNTKKILEHLDIFVKSYFAEHEH